VDDSVQTDPALDVKRQADAAHSDARHRAVADVDAVDPDLSQHRRAVDDLGGVEALRRIELDADDKFSLRQHLLERRRLDADGGFDTFHRGRGGTGCGDRVETGRGVLAGRLQGRPHRGDVLRCRAAAAADEADAGVDEPLSVLGEVLGR
jgi:hypothetical protein